MQQIKLMPPYPEDTGLLGFGTMRFPRLDSGETDIEQVKQMIDCFMDAGFNYFDTAWAYVGSDAALHEALVKRYPRDSYYVATKISPWFGCTSEEDLEKQLSETLGTLGLDYVDYLLVHNLGAKRTVAANNLNAWEFALAAKERGLAKHVGFSSHAIPEELEELLNEHPQMEFVQLMVNYADWDDPVARLRDAYDIAVAHDIPIIVMEPVKGGMLAQPPVAVQEAMRKHATISNFPNIALRFAASLPNVQVVLSGMSTLEQVQQNVASFKDFSPLDDGEKAAVNAAIELLQESGLVSCTACNYCAKVCPQEIGISGSMAALNYLHYFDLPVAKMQLKSQVTFNALSLPSECIKCGACEDVCPQQLPIRDLLQQVVDEIENAETPPKPSVMRSL